MSSNVNEKDALDFIVTFLSTIEGRSSFYRLIQFSAKLSAWTVSKPKPQDDNSTHNDEIVRKLKRVEATFSGARKIYRLFRFFDMLQTYRQVKDSKLSIRILKRFRISCFFLFFILENYTVFTLQIGLVYKEKGKSAAFVRRLCHGCWLLSILLAFVLDYRLNRGNWVSWCKNIADCPIAYILTRNYRVSDGLIGGLGLVSSIFGILKNAQKHGARTSTKYIL